ncbi:type I-E CRISPR-associated protein Cse2/CasB [Streptomyces sp. t39]|uniref:type I-E CRISPR-associated protein Cse2/CasB n=1 Tax=Streptomyces sp. t39 TaxID=1828156 RepID=UPI0011CD91DA|nr:type I-E CRISPR-associated protein Cse2/CasB [Streptomyces sp. t39]TXS52768.1 type I-E CRISPR-associated protein Cse2/CasB [Streptomyces sp. t39]
MTTHAAEPNKRHKTRTTYATFVRDVEHLCREDPGARAALRSGLRRDLDHPRARPMHRLLTPLLPEQCDDRTAQAHYTVASLIAAQPRHTFAPEPNDDEATAAEQDEQLLENGGEPAEAAASAEIPPYGTSFGATLGQAVIAKGASMRKSAAESRINLLTRQSLRGIHLHLPAAVNQVRTTDATIDWGQLLADLINWPYQSGRISRRWLQDFYRITASADKG